MSFQFGWVVACAALVALRPAAAAAAAAAGGGGDGGAAALARGADALHALQTQARHAPCVQRALHGVTRGACAALTDAARRAMALAFLRCHLRGAGRALPACLADDDVDFEAVGPDAAQACTARLSEGEFGVFTALALDIEHVCFYVTSALWLESIDVQTRELARASERAAVQLDEIVRMEASVRAVLDKLSAVTDSPVLLLALCATASLAVTVPTALRPARWPLLLLVAVRAAASIRPQSASPTWFAHIATYALELGVLVLVATIVVACSTPRRGRRSASEFGDKHELARLIADALRSAGKSHDDQQFDNIFEKQQESFQAAYLAQFDNNAGNKADWASI